MTDQQMRKLRVSIRKVCEIAGYNVEDYTKELKARCGVESLGAASIQDATNLIYEIELDLAFLR